MTKSTLVPIAVVVAGSIALATDAGAQIRASERGSVSQTIDGTTITVDYGRPNTRGRENLFGGVIPWGKVWTPGANWATTVATDHDITIDGNPLAAGRYSVWIQVEQEGWTAILDPEPRRFHLMPPPESDGQVRFPVEQTEAPNSTMLTWSFPDVRPTGATLQLAWGTTAVEFDISVEPSHPTTVTPEVAARYVGSYRMQNGAALGGEEVSFVIRYENERLVAEWAGAPNPKLGSPWLVPLGAGMFAPAEVEDGELFDIVMDLVFEFTPLDGTATSFEMRALGDALWATGERVSQ